MSREIKRAEKLYYQSWRLLMRLRSIPYEKRSAKLRALLWRLQDRKERRRATLWALREAARHEAHA